MMKSSIRQESVAVKILFKHWGKSWETQIFTQMYNIINETFWLKRSRKVELLGGLPLIFADSKGL